MKILFKKEKSTPSHITFRILGIRFSCLRPSIKRERNKIANYYQSFQDVSLIPPADGNLRLIQMANIALLEEFHSICIQNNLQYWIDFGTLLGAVRHKGFIPWDDDIDLGMLRDDYEKLIDLFKNGFPNNPELSLEFENNGKTKCFVKIVHKKSENLFLDIFPYDFYHSKLSIEEKQELSQKIVEERKQKVFKVNSSNDFLRESFKKITRENILGNILPDKAKKPALFMGIDFPHNWKNKVYDFENIFPLKEVSFEHAVFLAPNEPEKVLESIYGEYMTIPKNSYPRHSNYSEIDEDEKIFLEGFIK